VACHYARIAPKTPARVLAAKLVNKLLLCFSRCYIRLKFSQSVFDSSNSDLTMVTSFGAPIASFTSLPLRSTVTVMSPFNVTDSPFFLVMTSIASSLEGFKYCVQGMVIYKTLHYGTGRTAKTPSYYSIMGQVGASNEFTSPTMEQVSRYQSQYGELILQISASTYQFQRVCFAPHSRVFAPVIQWHRARLDTLVILNFG
jgi:hypothetical protein